MFANRVRILACARQRLPPREQYRARGVRGHRSDYKWAGQRRGGRRWRGGRLWNDQGQRRLGSSRGGKVRLWPAQHRGARHSAHCRRWPAGVQPLRPRWWQSRICKARLGSFSSRNGAIRSQWRLFKAFWQLITRADRPRSVQRYFYAPLARSRAPIFLLFQRAPISSLSS